VRVERFDGAAQFLARAGDFLAEREAEHNLILGLAARLQADRHAFGPDDPYLAAVEHGGRVVAAALRTPPFQLTLSEVDDARAVDALVADLRELGPLPAVLGPSEPARRFAQAWEAATGTRASLTVAERIHSADAVAVVPAAEGRMRPYDPRDRELVVEWFDAFVAEADAAVPRGDGERMLERRLADTEAGIVLWDDGGPVSVACFGGRTPNGIRIGPVYTPPGRRRRGYAGALVAELTRRLLADGHRFCFLFTDLANETSNRLYARIGYRPVSNVDRWELR
jgi:predicted GNAT family acetyltransferase